MLSNKSRLGKLIILALSLFLAHLRAKQVISLEDYNDCCNSILALTEVDHETFASGSYDGTIRIYGLQQNGLYTCKAELIGHTAAIISLAKLNNNIFISSSRDKTIRIWKKNIDGLYACKSVFHDPTDPFNTIVRLTDWIFVSYASDKTILIWGVNQSEDFACIKIGAEFLLMSCITSVSNLHNNGFVLGDDKGSINVYKNNTHEPSRYKQELNYPLSKNSICSLIHLSNGDVIASYDKTILIFHLDERTNQYEYKEALLINNKMPILCPVSSCPLYSSSFAVASWDENPTIDNQWHINIFERHYNRHYECTGKLRGLASEITSIIQLDNGCIVSGEIDGTITIWQTSDLEKENTLAV
jgi:WD40 repeat protein